MANCLRFIKRIWWLMNRRKVVRNEMDTELRRCLTTFDLTLIGLGHMMGSGVYILTGNVVKTISGPSTCIAYFLSGIVAMLSALCYAQFSVNIPKAGTAYNYVYVIAGEVWGYLAGWNLLLENLISVTSVARAFSGYIDSLAGNLFTNASISLFGYIEPGIFGQVDFLAAGLICVVFILVAVGVRHTTNVNNFMASLNTVVLVTFIISSFVIGSPSNFGSQYGGFFPFGVDGVVRGAGTLFFTYVGFDAIAVASEEAKDPSKSLPIAMCVAVSIAATVYSLASLSLVFLVPYQEVDLGAPFPEAFARNGQPVLGTIINVGALFAMTCSLLGQAFILPRSIYPFAEDGLLCAVFKYVNKTTRTPLISVLASTIAAVVVALFIDLQAMVEIVSIGSLFAMALMTACLIKLHYIPAAECPFEMLQWEGAVNIFYTPDVDIITTSENKPILKKEKRSKQNPLAIGRLRYKVPILYRYDSDKVTTWVILLLFASLTVLALLIIQGASDIMSAEVWALILLVISLSSTAILLSILLLYEHNKSFKRFSVPLMPWMPAFTLFIQLCLMMILNAHTWIRLVAWIAVGLIIYFIYGIRKSNVESGDYKIQEDSLTSISGSSDKVNPQ